MTCNHGCFSDGFGTGRHGNGMVDCRNFGPFTAVDAACIIPPGPPAVVTTGSIIPYASGATSVALTSIAGGLIGTTGFVGFGTAVPGITLVGGEIPLAGLFNEAFSVPRAGSITAISASFTELVGLAVIGDATITVQIYRAVAGSNTFSPTTALVTLGPISGAIGVNTTFSNASSSFAPVSVAVGDRLLLQYSVTSSGLGTLINAFAGSASAGITIA